MEDISNDIFDPEFLGFDLEFEQEVASLFSFDKYDSHGNDCNNSPIAQAQGCLSTPLQHRVQEPPSYDVPHHPSNDTPPCDSSSESSTVTEVRTRYDLPASSTQTNHQGSHPPHHWRTVAGKKKRRKASKVSSSDEESTKKNRVESIPDEDLVAPSDPRRSYAKNFLNAFNTSDIKAIEEIFRIYCDSTDDYGRFVYIHRYDGVKNPYGRDHLQITGVSAVISLWSELVKSMPDHLFTSLESRACYLPQAIITSHVPRAAPGDRVMVVACRYNWCGTRVRDITVAEELQIGMQALSLHTETSREQATTVRESQLFDNSQSSVLPLQHPKFQVEEKPLTTRIKMKCVGTLLVYIVERAADVVAGSADPAGKVAKLEFVYTQLLEDNS